MDTSPGLVRLRQHPDAERVRQATLRDQQRARAAVVTPPQPQAKPTGRTKRYRRPDHAKIVVLVANPPKRGTARARFLQYRSGMTVGEYRTAIGDRALADRDLAWDMRRGYVRVDV